MARLGCAEICIATRLLERTGLADHARPEKIQLQTGPGFTESFPHCQQCLLVCQAPTGSIFTGWRSPAPSLLHSLARALQYCFVERHTQPGSTQQPHHDFNLFFETPLELIEQAYTVVVDTGGTVGASHLFNCTERAASVCK